MSRSLVLIAAFSLVFSALFATSSPAFRQLTLSSGQYCTECHSLSVEEAASIVSFMNPTIKVLEVNPGPVEGLWEVVIEARSKKGLAYIDYSKNHIITGSIRKISTKENLTALRLYELSKVDLSSLDVSQAIPIGNSTALYKVVVFTDPECFTCRRLHLEMRKVVKRRRDIVFFVKLYPHEGQPGSYKKAKAITCAKSLRMLGDAFTGKKIPAPTCETTEIDDNIKLVKELGITRPPVLIMPDGAIVPEKDADTLTRMIDAAAKAAGIKPEPEPDEEALGEDGLPITPDDDAMPAIEDGSETQERSEL